MTIVVVVIWAAVIPAVVLGIRYPTDRPGSGDRAGGGSSPQQVLAERFARGEIDEDGYRRRATMLREHHGP